MNTTLRKVKPDAYGLQAGPSVLSLLRYDDDAEFAVDVFSLEGEQLEAGVLTDLGEIAGVSPLGVPLADGYWAILDTRVSDEDVFRIVVWKPGEAPRVYSAPGVTALPRIPPFWDPIARRLVWLEFLGGGEEDPAYAWRLRSSTLAGFPSAATGASLTVDREDWPPVVAGETVALWPRRLTSVYGWVSSQVVALQAELEMDASASPGDERHLRFIRIDRVGTGRLDDYLAPAVGFAASESPVLVPDEAHVFLGGYGHTPDLGFVLTRMAVDGTAVGTRPGAPALRTIGPDGYWTGEVWSASLAAEEFPQGLHQHPSGLLWALLTVEDTTRRVYVGSNAPGAPLELPAGLYVGVALF